MTVSEWLKDMAAAGFDGEFTASNGADNYIGEIRDGKVFSRKLASANESREKIKAIFNGTKKL